MKIYIRITKRRNSIIIVLLLSIFALSSSTNKNCYSNNNSDSKIVHLKGKKNLDIIQYVIKSIKINRTGVELTDPIIELNSNETITLSFDDLSDESTSYSYTIVHCNKDWEQSNLSIFDFLDGFEYNSLTKSENSSGTTIPYLHYVLQVPNENIKLKVSGNYIIRVVDTYDYSKTYFEAKFMIVESIVSINSSITQPIIGDKRFSSQQLNLQVKLNNLSVINPNNEVFTFVYQNNQLSNSLSNIQPVFFNQNEINFSSSEGLIFDGGNEYRSFDTKSIRYNSPEIDNIIQNVDGFNVMLKPDENNRSTQYSNNPDINGKYLIQIDRSEQSDVEADYVWVYFTLPFYDNLAGKEVYVYGELSDWLCKPEFKMNYNYQRSAYELRTQLKQGFYNYRYIVKDTKTGLYDPSFFEGNHFDSENDYLILVYYRNQGIKYDRLVGVKKINSIKSR